jgi:hypothetical protein
MKIKYIELDQDNTRKYPVILEGNQGLLVLFTEPKTGVVIRATNFWSLGSYSNDWGECSFSKWNGVITIEQ